MNPYRGITYPHFLSYKFCLKIWKKLFCKKDIHLFNEVFAADLLFFHPHYLSCDACGLIVNIKNIDDIHV